MERHGPGVWSRFLALLTVMAACSGPVLAAAETAPPSVTVRLTKASADRWALAYELSRPFSALGFGSPIGDLRAEAWRPEEGFELSVVDGTERLARPDGASFDRVSLELRTYDEIIPKQYVPFNAFSDGGVSVYTGFLTAEGRDADGGVELATTFVFVPAEGEAVVIGGVRREGTTTWPDPDGSPAFVYFGPARPIESPSLIAIVDPATPELARSRFEAFLPTVFAYLSERFGRRLSRRPTVLISARFDDGDQGRSIKGGALDGQIQVRLRGEQVRRLVDGVGEDPRPAVESLLAKNE